MGEYLYCVNQFINDSRIPEIVYFKQKKDALEYHNSHPNTGEPYGCRYTDSQLKIIESTSKIF